MIILLVKERLKISLGKKFWDFIFSKIEITSWFILCFYKTAIMFFIIFVINIF